MTTAEPMSESELAEIRERDVRIEFGDRRKLLAEVDRLRALLEERPRVLRCDDTNCGCRCILPLGHRGGCDWRVSGEGR